jgi:hypothetical protein
MTPSAAYGLVKQELGEAMMKYPPMHSFHEGYAIILEEVRELEAEVFKKHSSCEDIEKELVQVAAMAIRALIELTPSMPEVIII